MNLHTRALFGPIQSSCFHNRHRIPWKGVLALCFVVTCVVVAAADTVVFQDDFELDTFASWDAIEQGSGAALDTTSDIVARGAMSLRVTLRDAPEVEATLRKDFEDGLDQFYIRFFLYIDEDLTLNDGGELYLVNALDETSGNDLIAASMMLKKRSDAQYTLLWLALDNVDESSFIESVNLLRTNRWYCIELRYVCDKRDGGIECWIDGRYQGRALGRDNSLRQVRSLYVGSLKAELAGDVSGHVYYDDLIIADTRIGGSTPFVPDVSVSLNTLDFQATYGRTEILTGQFKVLNEGGGGGECEWHATADMSWLSLVPDSGLVMNADNPVAVSADISELALGTHDAIISVSNSVNPQNEEIIIVTLVVNEHGTVLFHSDFEDEDFIDWGGRAENAAISVQATADKTMRGERAMKLSFLGNGGEGAYVYESLATAPNEIYGCLYVCIGETFTFAQPHSAVHLVAFGYRDDPLILATGPSMVIEELDAETLCLYWSYYHGDNLFDSVRSFKIQRGQWYRVECRYVCDPYNGGIEYWVDGVYQAGIMRRDTSGYPCNTVYCGAYASDVSADPEGDIFLDSLVLADNRVGEVDSPFLPRLAISHEDRSKLFELTEGDTAHRTDTLTIYNGGGGQLEWLAVSDSTWLSVTPSSGTCTNTFNLAEIGIDVTLLSVGTTVGTITIQSVMDPHDTIPVEITVKVYENGTAYFEEDFESAVDVFDGWTKSALYGAAMLSVTADDAVDSQRSLKVDFSEGSEDESFLYKTFAESHTEFYFRLYLRLSEDYAISDIDRINHVLSCGYRDQYKYIPAVSLAIERSLTNELRVRWSYFSNREHRQLNYLKPFEVKKGVWYCMEIHYVSDQEHGGMEHWVDGQYYGWYWGRDTSGYAVNSVSIGNLGVDQGASVQGSVFFDGIVIGDRHVGCHEPFVPKIALMTDTLTFAATEGKSSPKNRTLGVYNRGGGRLNWVASHDIPWLTLDSSSGVVIDTISEITLFADSGGRASGTYNGTLMVTNVTDITDSKVINVVLDVNERGTSYFSEDFESGTLDEWRLVDTPYREEDRHSAASLDICQEPPDNDHMLQINYTGEGTKELYLIRDLGDVLDDVYMRLSFFLDDVFSIADVGTSVFILSLRNVQSDTSTAVATLVLDKNGQGEYEIRWMYDDLDGDSRLTKPVVVSKMQWHTVEFHHISKSSQSGIRYWMNGVYQGDYFTQEPFNAVNSLSLGSLGVTNNEIVHGSIYIDDVVVGDTRVGCEDPYVPKVGLTTDQILFDAYENKIDTLESTVGVYNRGGGELDFIVSDDAEWLSVNPALCCVRGATQTLTLSADPSLLPLGIHRALVSVCNGSFVDENCIVQITLEVHAGDPPVLDMSTSPERLYFAIEDEELSARSQTLRILNAGPTALEWAAVDSVGWLDVNPAAGTIEGGQYQDVLVTVNDQLLYLDVVHTNIRIEDIWDPRTYCIVDLTVGKGMWENFDPTAFSGWVHIENGTGARVSLEDAVTPDDDHVLKTELLGAGGKEVYLWRGMGATYREFCIGCSFYLDGSLVLGDGDAVTFAGIGSETEGVYEYAASLKLVGQSGGSLALVVEYSDGDTRSVFTYGTVDIGRWYTVDVRYVADHLNGGCEYWVDGIRQAEMWGLSTRAYEMNAVSVGSVAVVSSADVTGSILIDTLSVRKSHRGLGTNVSSVHFEGSVVGGEIGHKEITVYNIEATPLTWKAFSNEGWLHVTPSGGCVEQTLKP